MALLRWRGDWAFTRCSSDSSTVTDHTETKLGFNTGGGVDYFLNRTLAVMGEDATTHSAMRAASGRLGRRSQLV